MKVVIFALFLMQPRIFLALLTLKGPVAPGNKLANIIACKHIVGVSVTLKHQRLFDCCAHDKNM